MKATLVTPLLVVRLREASPPRPQMLMNSLNGAPRNWEFDFEDIFWLKVLAEDRLTL